MERGAFLVKEFLAWARISQTKFYDEVKNGRLILRKAGRRSLVTMDDAKSWRDALPTGIGPRPGGKPKPQPQPASEPQEPSGTRW